MKTIIAGSRTIVDPRIIAKAISASGMYVTEVVCGMAAGVDTLGLRWAKSRSIPVKLFPAGWDKYGKRAGYLRNQEMAKYADALIAVWNGESKGTRHMIEIAKKEKLQVFVYDVNNVNGQ
jgi:glycerophosphoryl diester phosphodiesterase